MKKVSKKYGYKDVAMLIAAKTVACNFKDNISELSNVNANWNEAYADDMLARIEDALNTQLGFDAKLELRGATSSLRNIMSEVKKDLMAFKLHVKTLFKSEPQKRDEMLYGLGYKHYSSSKVSSMGQADLINLLFAFKTNLSDKWRKDFTAKGIQSSLINKIIANATEIEQSNIVQEVLKGNVGETLFKRTVLYNAIYHEVSGICVIAASHFRALPAKKALFVFGNIVRAASKRQKQNGDNPSENNQGGDAKGNASPKT